ncbi:MAG: penicillin-binding transpeptidase domain-containing protein [Defluviitaleaceae bacterium]|nr:penicillin-binding transpeptidase domain-containing protein [Defluviitaleaceae bacterium]
MKYELKTTLKSVARGLYRFFSHRLLWLLIIAGLLFYVLLVELFNLQLTEPEVFRLTAPVRTGEVSRSLPALRGTIYDRHGRPLATNELTFVVKMDPSVRISNEALLELALLFERNQEDFVDSLPIAISAQAGEPFVFTIDGASEEAIRRRENHWKREMAIPNYEEATAEDAWNDLRDRQFRIDPELSLADARRIMNFAAKIHEQRFLGFASYEPTPIIFAYDVSPATIAAIEEQPHFFSGLFIDIETRRVYPGGRYVSHMIGYIRQINAQQLERNEHLGYTENDMFGQTGLELSMEHALRGTPGRERFEVNAAGRRISEPIRYVEPQPGDKIFLTIDLELQMAAFYVLEDALSEAIIGRLSLRSNTEPALTLQDVFTGFVNAHNLDLRAVLDAEPGSHAYPMREYVLARFPDANTHTLANRQRIQSIIVDGIERRRISPAMMLLTLIGTSQISDENGEVSARLISQPNNAQAVLIEKIRARELTPHLLNVDPSTGSLIITCTDTGAVLAAVTYPSFDNNRLVNNFDNEYFTHINSLDPTHPMINRPFRETRAPGSSFKMFTATAALEEGVIGPTTRIQSRAAFTAAGIPHVPTWNRRGHGNINVSQAIAVSCNYFFAEVAFRLGGRGTAPIQVQQGIEIFGQYMDFFGFNGFSGVEIGDHPIGRRALGYEDHVMPSPEFKRFRHLQRNPFAPANTLSWTAGDTSLVSIGQGYSDYTVAQMVRGISTIANRGVNYYLHLVGYVADFNNHTVSRTQPTYAQTDMEFSDSTWDAIIEGMRLVTEPGASGTAIRAFESLRPYIRVAGKTGTAEHGGPRLSHSTFGAFAPLEDPQIAIFVSVPFGTTGAYSQISAQVARDTIAVALGLGHEPQHPPPINTLLR